MMDDLPLFSAVSLGACGTGVVKTQGTRVENCSHKTPYYVVTSAPYPQTLNFSWTGVSISNGNFLAWGLIAHVCISD